MIPLYVMAAGILTARLAGALWWPVLSDWQAAARAGLALMFVFTGMAHFTGPRADLVRMVPPRLPFPGFLVTITGIAELTGAVGLVVPSLSRMAAYGLMALLVLMFPANVYAAQSGHTIAGRRHSPLPLRAIIQVFWIGLLWWSVQDAPPVRWGQSGVRPGSDRGQTQLRLSSDSAQTPV
jgi:uncharacterized membrane protein